MILMIPLFMPYGQTAQAYGVTNHENVIEVGKDHFVVLKNDGSVWSWGDHKYGQLGDRLSALETDKPSAIRREDGTRLLGIKSIAAGGDHTVALDNEGNVWTWGRNSHGQLGYATAEIRTSTEWMVHHANPEMVMLSEGVPLKAKAISAGEFHTLAVDESGQVWAWGSGDSGQIGQLNKSTAPILVSGLSNVVAVAAGGEHSLALTAEGAVYAWGRGTNGQLGNGQSGHENPVPKKIDSLTNVMAIAAGDNHSLAIAQNNTTIWAWGSNTYGQLGDGGRQDRLKPVQVSRINGVKMIAAGNDHTIAVKDDGSVWTWGRNTEYNTWGQPAVRTTPIQIQGVNNAFAIGGGGANKNSYTLAIHQDGTVWKWDQTSFDSTSRLPIFKQVSGIDEVMEKIEYPFVQGGQVLFKYIGTNDIKDVKVFGSFNDWNEIPLVQRGNEWTFQTELPAGKHEYGFKVNGRWISDPLNLNKGFSAAGDPISYLTVDSYATVGPVINDREVTFTYSSFDYNGQLEFDAETTEVVVRGSFDDWFGIPLKKQPNNTWSVTKTLPLGEHTYYYEVRDAATGAVAELRLDPLNENVVDNPITGSQRNKFTVEEQILTKVPVEKVELDRGPAMDMVVGEQTMLRAIISPSNATDKDVSWSSSDPSVVSVDNGQLIAHAEGRAVIFVASLSNASKNAMITITVNQQDGALKYPLPGFKPFGNKTGVAPNKVWYIKFSEELDEESLNSSNVYVRDEMGTRIPVGWTLSNKGETLEVSLQGGNTYKPGATYHLFIEDTVKTKYGQKKLKEKIHMRFTIALEERALTEVNDSSEDIIEPEDVEESTPDTTEQ